VIRKSEKVIEATRFMLTFDGRILICASSRSRFHGENHPKARLSGHRLGVTFRGFHKRRGLDHWQRRR
jgi:hypothetical protein